MNPDRAESAEVVVVGAGAAGVAAALALSARGREVTVVDVRSARARAFRAEKLEPNQLEAAARLGARPLLEKAGVPIPDVVDAHDGRILSRQRRSQLGLRYEGIASVLADALSAAVRRRNGRVSRIEPGPEGAVVSLSEGPSIRARLVVLASGRSTGLSDSLGIDHALVADYRSTTFGFDVARADGAPFPHAALTVYPGAARDRAAYISFFAVPGATRVNLFTYIDTTSAVGRAIRTDPLPFVRGAFPRLERLTGPLIVHGNVAVGPIELTTAVDPVRPSVVLVGDAFQTVCPSTGTGLEKSFRDAETLAEHAPAWLDAGGASADRVRAFYEDGAKRRVDRGSIEAALYRRRVTLEDTWRMRLHRERSYAAMRYHDKPLGRVVEIVVALASWATSSG